MMQAQLLHMALNPRDVVYTPDDVARDVVEFFKPTGRILEPCAGDGVFLKYLPPDTDWCEIEKGRDFFANHEPYDWIIGNPPYSDVTNWLRHSFKIADNVVFVIPAKSPFMGIARFRLIFDYGGIKTSYVVGSASEIGWDGGMPIAAVHFQKGYKGGTFTVFRDSLNTGTDRNR